MAEDKQNLIVLIICWGITHFVENHFVENIDQFVETLNFPN